MPDLRPEHLPVIEAGKCIRCGLSAEMHRPVRKRTRQWKKRKIDQEVVVTRLERKIRASILRDIQNDLKRSEMKWGSPNMMCRCGATFSEHAVIWPHQRGACIGFTPKQQREVVSCITCQLSFYSTIGLPTHFSACTRIRGSWTPVSAEKKELKVCCVGCQRHFYRVGMFNKHCKVIVCKWTRREVNYSLIADG
jgi:hypothetical protein